MRNTPCRECKIRQRRCIWKGDDTKECDRCSKLGIECIATDKDTPLTKAQDYHEKLQSRWKTVNELDSEMGQLVAMKTAVEQDIVTRQRSRMEWQLSIINGVLKLETPIRTIEEVIMFSYASRRYLSPFAAMFNIQPIRFESASVSITLGLVKIIQRHKTPKPRRKQLAVNGYDRIPDHRDAIDYLVPLYLKHYNSAAGMVHEPNILERYHDLDDPTNSAILLAICIDTLSRIRHLLKYSPIETYMLSESLYNRCKDLLFDMYNDPSQMLEVVIVTSLLQHYLSGMLLNYLEANRLASVALLACADLQKNCKSMTPVERVLFQRHYFNLELTNRLSKMLHDGKVDFEKSQAMNTLEVLDDEPEKVKEYISFANHFFRLFGSHYVSSMLTKITKIFYGEYCDIALEDIVGYEPFLKDWWASLPLDYQVCKNPFDLDAYKLVEGKVTSKYLPFIGLHIMTGVFTSSILQPHVLPTSESTATMETIQIIRKNSISLALSSCKVLMHALNKNWDPYASDMPNYSLSIMQYAVYCLERLSYCSDIRFPAELLNMLMKSLRARSKALFPSDHTVPLSSSLLTSYQEKSKKSLLEIYEDYTFPGIALLSDILFTSVNRLVDQHLTVSCT
ncbi:hypothetical protein BJV82DRAFT_666641 [Fennellomyces sp. T-0311]|nr:hypothetical protein BJV82DRAFT_666641 [Fennellomyces sp. T-0311]